MKKIGRYEILQEIGRGAMGVVYLARDPVIDRQLAIKTIRLMGLLEAKESGEFVQRFYQEARAAGRLSHPGIVTIHDAGFDGESEMHFIAMEYIPGRNLKEIIKEGVKLGLRDMAAIIARVAAAIGYAHQHSIVHRDIKPANIIINEKGDVKITDFGIAKVPASHLTADGQYLGTPSYMSPEQILGNAVDGRSDIFSLGIVFYELLTGRKPFPGENMTQVSHRIAYDPPVPALDARPDTPPEFDRILAKALAKEPAARYQDAFAFATELQHYLGRAFKAPVAAAGDVTVAVSTVPAPPSAQPPAGPGKQASPPSPHLAPAPVVDENKTAQIPLPPAPADEAKTAMLPIVPVFAPPAGPVQVDDAPKPPQPAVPQEAARPTTPTHPIERPAGPPPPPPPSRTAPPAKPSSAPPLPPPPRISHSAPSPAVPPSETPRPTPSTAERPTRPERPSASSPASTPPLPPPIPQEGPAAVLARAKDSLRRRFSRWFSTRKGLEFLSYEIYFRWVLTVIAAWTLFCALVLIVLFIRARTHSAPITPERRVPAVEWRQAMQEGVALLGRRDFAGALDRFQGVLMQVPDSPALRALVKRALAEQEADLLAKGAGARLEYYLQSGEEAFKRRDNRTAKEFFLSALDVDPENATAKEYLAKLESKPRSRKPVPPAPAPLPPTPAHVTIPPPAAAPEAEPAPAGAPEALVSFESPVPKGYITINLDGAQALREEFNFYRKKGLMGKEFVPGTLQKNLAVTAGEHEVKAWVSDAEGKYTAHASARHDFRPGSRTAVILVLQPASKSLQIQFKEQ